MRSNLPKYLVSIVMLVGSGPSWAVDSKQASEEVKDCKGGVIKECSEVDSAAPQGCTVSTAAPQILFAGNQTKQTKASADAYKNCADLYTTQAGSCSEKGAKACEDSCTKPTTTNPDPQDLKDCKSKVEERKTAMETKASSFSTAAGDTGQSGDGMSSQSDGNGNADEGSAAANEGKKSGGGGMDPGMLMAGALGVGAGVLGYMAFKKMTEKKPETEFPGALRPDGTLNCYASDSYKFPGCDEKLTGVCTGSSIAGSAASASSSQIPNMSMVSPGGAAAQKPDCEKFNARFCTSSNPTPPQPIYVKLADNKGVMQVAVGGSGEGAGSPYCIAEVADKFCTEPSTASARVECPSCTNRQNASSSTCNSSPGSCLGNYSSTQITQTAQSATCNQDPIITDAANSYLGTAATTALANAANGTVQPVTSVDPNAPAVILPPQSSSLVGGSQVTLPGATDVAGTSTTSSGILLSASGGRAPSATLKTASAGPTSDISGAYSGNLASTVSAGISSYCSKYKAPQCP